MIQCLARVPNILQLCREASPCALLSESALLELKYEIQSMRQDCKAMTVELRDRLSTFNLNSAPVTLRAHVHALYLSLYGMGLATGIILNCILNMLGDDCVRLCEESSHYSSEIFQVAKSAVKYQPLGSLAMVIWLVVAWLGAPNSDTKERVHSLLSDYQRACAGSSASNLTADLESIRTRFTSKAASHKGPLSDAGQSIC